MKRSFILLSLLPCLLAEAQENKTWRWGLQLGLHDNASAWAGGRDQAHARFEHHKHANVSLHGLARYDHNEHWMATLGSGFSTYGFQFGIRNNYRLSDPANRLAKVEATFVEFEMPVLVHYKFNLNCRQRRWIIGAGIVHSLSARTSVTDQNANGNDGFHGPGAITLTANNHGGTGFGLRFSIAYERVFKAGSMLQIAWVLNTGLRDKASATVAYRLDSEDYQHTFRYQGNFAGLKLAYFFAARKS